MLNDNCDGTHSFRVFGDNYKYDKNFDVGTLQSLIKNARKALRYAYWGSEEDWKDGLELRHGNESEISTLEQDLILLARRGADFWVKLTQKVAPDGNAIELSEKLLQPSVIEFVIKDPSEAANYMFPSALIYDYPLVTSLNPNEYSLCSCFTEALKHRKPLKETRCFKGDCPSRNNAAHNIVCPSGFWGFRHSIGLPLGSSSEATQEILFTEFPEITAAACPTFSNWHTHQQKLISMNSSFKWHIAETSADTFTHLKSTHSHLVYFYCHGGYDNDTPFIALSDNIHGRITPTDLVANQIRWNDPPQPIVFVNGCHTLGIDPKLILDFASTFVISLKAAGVMGTEITIFEPLACSFAEEWLKGFLLNGRSSWIRANPQLCGNRKSRASKHFKSNDRG
jgi:hypothetical protein